MTWELVLLTVVLGLLVNQCDAQAEWCAHKLVHWSAFCRYPNHARAAERAEELTALINERPGNLFKLVTALSFVFGAVVTATHRRFAQRGITVISSATPPALNVTHPHSSQQVSCSDVLQLVYDYLDGDMDQVSYAQVKVHLEDCGPCLREFGLEEAVKRLVHKHCGHNPVPEDLRTRVLTRIEAVRSEIEANS